jgi:hypothetical protein
MMLPAIVRNRVGSCADSQGRVYYALMPRGWEWLDAASKYPPTEHNDAEPHEACARLYYQWVKASLARLNVATPQDAKQIGGIPLPVATEGLELLGPCAPGAV